MLIDLIDRTEPRKAMIYGVGGIGKTTWATSWPDPILLSAEGGGSGMKCKGFSKVASTMDIFREQIDFIENGNHSCQTLVIDPINWIERFKHQEIAASKGKATIKDCGFADDGYLLAVPWWDTLIQTLERIRVRRQMHQVLVAHADKTSFIHPEHGKYEYFSPKMHPSAWSMLVEWCDDVLFACFPMVTKTDSTDTSKKQSRRLAVSAGDRVVYTTQSPTRIAKNRLRGCPEEISLDFDDYWQYVPQSPEKPVC